MTAPPVIAPALSDLPPPPAGKSGWPWTEASPSFPPRMPNGGEWPKISIITPSFNQAIYLEETIRSVLLQGYPNLEFFIIDGGSNDGSVDIIRKYEPWLAGWVSEKDSGQSEAINKGFSRCTGEIFNWLCSDDLLTPGALAVVAAGFAEDKNCDVLAGACFCQYDEEPQKSEARSAKVDGWEKFPWHAAIWQPSCFFKRALISASLTQPVINSEEKPALSSAVEATAGSFILSFSTQMALNTASVNSWSRSGARVCAPVMARINVSVLIGKWGFR